MKKLDKLLRIFLLVAIASIIVSCVGVEDYIKGLFWLILFIVILYISVKIKK